MNLSRRGFLMGCGAALPVIAGFHQLSCGSAYAAEAGDGVGDPVYPTLGNKGYRVESYHLDVAYSAETKLVTGTVTMIAKTTDEIDSLSLDAKALTIKSVTVDSKPRTFRVGNDKLMIDTGRLREGRTVTVKTTYSADPRAVKPVDGGGFIPCEDGFATAPQPVGARTIFPCNDHPSDKARYSFRITAPEGSVGVANGEQVLRETREGSNVTEWKLRDPMATELLQLAVGKFDIIDRGTVGGVHLRDVVPTARKAELEAALALTPGILKWATDRLGDHPFEAYGLLPVNNDDPKAFEFTGLETQTLTLYKPGYLKNPEDKIASHMMHEMTHAWWGNSVTPRDWSALWLNEGHAEFYALTYRYQRGWPDFMGLTTFTDRMKYVYSMGDEWRRASGPVAKPTSANLFDNQRYTGGTLALYALRQRIGGDAFDRLERDFVTVNRNKVVTTEDYIEAASRVSGDKGVRTFLEDWVYGTKTPPMPGHPDWTVKPPAAKPQGDSRLGVSGVRSSRADLQTDRLGL